MNEATKSELHQGMQDGIARGHGGFDIALTPMLCGLIGFWIDSQLGWVPVLTVAFTVIGFIGVVAKTYYVYQYRMNLELERRAPKTAAANSTSGKSVAGKSVAGKSITS